MDSGGNRRSSGRSLKRKKFDDELVESGLAGKKKQAQDSAQASQLPSQGQPTGKSKTKSGAFWTWPPEDDYRLICNIQQVSDLIVVQRAVKFSKTYTLKEIKDRCYNLLYNQDVSRVAKAAMATLDEEERYIISKTVLFSPTEENLLRDIRPLEHEPSPPLEIFQELLQSKGQQFLASRTPLDLKMQWNRLRHHDLLSAEAPLGSNEESSLEKKSFRDLCESLQTPATGESPAVAQAILRELECMDAKQKRKIRALEYKLSAWRNITELGMEPGMEADGISFDDKTLAILNGPHIKYKMQSQEIVLGQNTRDNVVDVDLSLNQAGRKVSRRHCVIRLKHDRQFYLTNYGRRPVYINGQPVTNSSRCRLFTNSIIEVCSAKMLFVVNVDLLHEIRLEQ
eukprot:m.52747 g.52747  ORF g.52747 m.52747 type:complete len:397 (-) comp10815_c0_seq1:1760-2950(-)